MRVPLSWLRDYVDVDLPPERLADRLTLLGMEVKGLERWGADWRNVVTGELLEVVKHPRADRLSLTKVRVRDEVLEIVCGATNIAPGQRVPVALPGAVLPGNRAIERTEKLGVVSNGMLCSGDELRLTGDADGILILPADTPLGVPLADLYGDIVLDVDVKPNRGDALSLVGLAREVAAITGAPVRFPEVRLAEGGGTTTAGRLAVAVDDPVLCPRFVGRWVAGVSVRPSPDPVQMRLLAAGMRPVSNVVDATNYVMLELGKPTHAFDAAAVARDGGGRAALRVRLADPVERLETLDHVERELTPETLLIADPRRALAIAGVMGGAASEVSESTSDVIIESAVFDPVSIRRTAFHFALRSEASLRFEKGQEARLDRLLGTALPEVEQAALLERVSIGFEPAAPGTAIDVARGEKPLTVTAVEPALVAIVPTWRRDLHIEADVAEEIARVAGYDSVPTKTPDTPMPHYRPSPVEARNAIRRALVGAGITEVVTPALVPEGQAARLAWPAAAADGVPGQDAVAGATIRVRNPLSERHAVLRSGLVASLLDALALNERHGSSDVAIFEIGKGYAADPAGTPAEWWRLGFLLTGDAVAPTWSIAGRAWDVEDAKAVAGLVAHVVGAPAPEFRAWQAGPPLHPGRAATVIVPGRLAGLLGEIHPETLEAWDLRAERVLVGELAVEGLGGGQLVPVRVAPVGRHASTARDLALVVAGVVPAGEVAATLAREGGDLLRSAVLFDVYRGAPLDATEKSLAWSLELRSDDRALEEGEVDALMTRLVEAVAAAHGGRLRA